MKAMLEVCFDSQSRYEFIPECCNLKRELCVEILRILKVTVERENLGDIGTKRLV
jgi:hypothetical protein